jgi:hypothetical protein
MLCVHLQRDLEGKVAAEAGPELDVHALETREILRLKSEVGWSHRDVAASLGVGLGGRDKDPIATKGFRISSRFVFLLAPRSDAQCVSK